MPIYYVLKRNGYYMHPYGDNLCIFFEHLDRAYRFNSINTAIDNKYKFQHLGWGEIDIYETENFKVIRKL